MEEIWKGVKDYEGIYEVSNLGNVRVVKQNELLKQGIDKDGYKTISLNKSGKRTLKRVHRLVYQAFNGELVKGMVIDHIDNNKANNTANNLQQVTNRFNTSKDRKTEIMTCIYANRNRFVVSVYGFSKSNYIGTFKTIDEAKEARDRAISEIEQGIKPTIAVKRNRFDKEGCKICSCCGKRKPQSEYYKTYGKCKECISKYNRQHREREGEWKGYRPRLTASISKRICTCCKKEKPLTEFYFARTQGRYQTKCKECFKKQVYNKRNNNK